MLTLSRRWFVASTATAGVMLSNLSTAIGLAKLPAQKGNPGIPSQRYKCVFASTAEVPKARSPTNAAAIVVRKISFFCIVISPHNWPIKSKSLNESTSEKADTRSKF